MTNSELDKFIEESGSDVSNEDGRALIWIPYCWLGDFIEIVNKHDLYEGGLDANLLQYRVFLDITDVCEGEDIDIEKIFKAY